MRPIELLTLPKRDKKRLETLLRIEKDAKMWRRYNILVLCSRIPRHKIVDEMKISLRGIGRITAVYKKHGLDGLKYKKPPGRPSKLSKKKQEKIISIIESNPQGWDTKHIREIVIERGGVTYTKRHIYRIAQKWGFAEVVPRTKSRMQNDIEVKHFKKKQRG